MKLTEREEQVLIGGLLGDGHLHMDPRGVNAYYREKKRNPDIGYLRWKANELARFRPRITEGEVTGSLQTRVHPELTKLWRRWYPKVHGRKQLDLEDVKKLGPLGLAVWAMDDGNLTAEFKFAFNTHGFGREGNKLLQRVLEVNFGRNAILGRNRSCWILCLCKREVLKMSEIIEPHVHPCMRRKIICAATLEKYKKYLQKQRERYATDSEYRAKKLESDRKRRAKKKSI